MIDQKKYEIANSITHGLAFITFIVASCFLLRKGIEQSNIVLTFSLVIFTISMLFLYGFSTIYHIVTNKKHKHILRHFDHIGIYILIAGSYTPLLLGAIGGSLGWMFFGIVWFLALCGILYEAFFLGKHSKLSLILYLCMGWIIVFIAKPFYDAVSAQVLIFILMEGLFYTSGTYFYSKDKTHTYYHSIWHIFVWLGTLSHFLAVWLIIPN